MLIHPTRFVCRIRLRRRERGDGRFMRPSYVQRQTRRALSVPLSLSDHRPMNGIRIVRPEGRCAGESQTKEFDYSIFHM
jgi:hypothetical protein